MDVERLLPGGGISIDTRIASIFAGRPSRARSRAANSQPKNPKGGLRGEMFSPGISNYTMVDYPLLSRVSVLRGRLFGNLNLLFRLNSLFVLIDALLSLGIGFDVSIPPLLNY